jgi:hypothetical protein
VNPDFIDKAVSTIQNAGGEVCFVKLDCPIDVIEQRLDNASRAQFFKLKSVAELPPGLTIDTSVLLPEQSARNICQYFEIPALSESPSIEHYPIL